jgi:glycosyltransferase involved in cell wall biosynthesis
MFSGSRSGTETAPSRKLRVAYLVTHPIQYQAPFLRKVAQDREIDLTVFFCSNFSVASFLDPEFGKNIAWDVPLLDGYRYEFLRTWRGDTKDVTFWKPWNRGLAKRLYEGKFDVLWVHAYRRFFHLSSMVSARLMGKRVMLRDEATLISSHYGPLKKLAKAILVRSLNSICTEFIAIGTLNREYYLQFGADQEKVITMPYAVDNEYFQNACSRAAGQREELRASLGLKVGRPIILYASKLIGRKRPADLLEAYIRLRQNTPEQSAPYLLFIGDGESRNELENRAADLKGDSIRFLGFKNQTELPCYYDLCDVFVLPSEREPWGLVINEVMNAGRAVIVSDRVGCAPDLVRNGYNGYVCKAGDVVGLSNALEQLFRTAGLYEAMGRRSLEMIQHWGFEEDIVALKRALSGGKIKSGPLSVSRPSLIKESR